MPRSATIATRTGREQQAEFFSLMAKSLQQRADFAEDVAETVPELLNALKELAIGHWYEKDTRDKGGELQSHVYRRSPDFRSLQFMLSLANYDTKANADALLSAVRAVTGLSQQNLMIEQERQSKALTAKTARETKAMDESYATEEQFKDMITTLTTGLISILQATPVSEFPRDDEGKTAYIDRVASKIKTRLDEMLGEED
jgi:hypothetical protein